MDDRGGVAKRAKEMRLTEREVQDVLAMASDIEARALSGGLTVGELESVASEVGIPAHALSRALQEVARTTEGRGVSFRTALVQRETCFVAGRVSDDALGWMLRLLDQLGHIKGLIAFRDGALVWKTVEGHRIELLNRSTETSVTVEADDTQHLITATVAFTAAGVMTATVITLMFSQDPEAATVLGGALAGLLGTTLYWRVRVNRVRERVVKMAGGVCEVVRMIARRGAEE